MALTAWLLVTSLISRQVSLPPGFFQKQFICCQQMTFMKCSCDLLIADLNTLSGSPLPPEYSFNPWPPTIWPQPFKPFSAYLLHGPSPSYLIQTPLSPVRGHTYTSLLLPMESCLERGFPYSTSLSYQSSPIQPSRTQCHCFHLKTMAGRHLSCPPQSYFSTACYSG